MVKSYRLDDLLSAVAKAVTTANRRLQEEHLADYQKHYDADSDGALRPRTLPIVLPFSHTEEGGEREGVHQIPEAALVRGHHVALDTLTFDFDVMIEGLDEPGAVSLALGSSKRRGTAGRLTVSFKGSDPPEGQARIDDQLLKTF